MHRNGGPCRRVHDGARRLSSHRSSREETADLGGERSRNPLFAAGVVFEGTGNPPGARLDGPLDAGDPAHTSFPAQPETPCRRSRHGRFVVEEEEETQYSAPGETTAVPQMDPVGTPRPASPLDPSLLEDVAQIVTGVVKALIEDPLAPSFTEERVAACVRNAVNGVRRSSPCPFRTSQIRYGNTTLSAVRYGIRMVSIEVPALATGASGDVVAFPSPDAMMTVYKIRSIIESARIPVNKTEIWRIGFGGWVSIAWCAPIRRVAVFAVEPRAEAEYYYVASLARMVVNSAIDIGATLADATSSIGRFDGRRGIHPGYATPDSPFLKWYGTLVPRPDGWTSPAGSRLTVFGPGVRDQGADEAVVPQ